MQGGTAGQAFAINATPSSATFDSNGHLTDPTAPGAVKLDQIQLADGASPLDLNWNLYDSSGSARLTQFAQASSTSANDQDGWAAAQLT